MKYFMGMMFAWGLVVLGWGSVQGQQIQQGLIQAASALDNATDVNFIAPGNDFAGRVIWLTNKQLTGAVSFEVFDVSVECTSQIRGLYYNSQRGERLWPLDDDTAADFNLPLITIDGGRYTDCTSTESNTASFLLEYSVFGSIRHEYQGNEYFALAGVEIDYENNSIPSNSDPWINSLQYINNQTPVGYIYDSAGGVGFVGGRVVAQDDTEEEEFGILGQETRDAHRDLLLLLRSAGDETINKAVSQQGGVGINLFGVDVVGFDASAAINTQLGFAILGKVGVGGGYTNQVKRSILGNTEDSGVFGSLDDTSASDRYNRARRNAHRLCAGVIVEAMDDSASMSDRAICMDYDEDVNIFMSHDQVCISDEPNSLDCEDINGRAISVEVGDVYIHGSHDANSEPFDLFVDRGDVYLVTDAGGRVDINTAGFPDTFNRVTEGYVYRMNMLVYGSIFGADETATIPHKVYIHGTLISLNPVNDMSDPKRNHIDMLNGAASVSTKAYNELFAWRCNVVSGMGTDGASCADNLDQFALIPLVVIDSSHESLFLAQ